MDKIPVSHDAPSHAARPTRTAAQRVWAVSELVERIMDHSKGWREQAFWLYYQPSTFRGRYK